MSFWCVAQIETQREPITRLLLERQGFETYLPLIKQRNRTAPLFAGYIFARVAADRWYPIAWTPHVIRLLMSGDKPAELRDEIVTAIRKREVGGFVRLPKKQRLTPGQPVTITAGALAGHVALYAGQSARDRERVLLELLGRKVHIELSAKDLAPLDVVVAKQHAC